MKSLDTITTEDVQGVKSALVKRSPKTTTSRSTNGLLVAARSDATTYLIASLGGEAGLRCGEIKALEWTDIDLKKRQLCVAGSSGTGT